MIKRLSASIVATYSLLAVQGFIPYDSGKLLSIDTRLDFLATYYKSRRHLHHEYRCGPHHVDAGADSEACRQEQYLSDCTALQDAQLGAQLDTQHDTQYEELFIPEERRRRRRFKCKNPRETLGYHADGYLMSSGGYFIKAGVTFSRFKLGSYNQLRPTVQVGAYWKDVGALRLGMFQGGPGGAVDLWIPLTKFKWLSSLELFRYKLDDCRNFFVEPLDHKAYIRWLNRVFLTDHLYISFGLKRFYATTGFGGVGFTF